jgi:hypothetical protein
MNTELEEATRKLKDEIYRKELRKLRNLMHQCYFPVRFHPSLGEPKDDYWDEQYNLYKKSKGDAKVKLAEEKHIQVYVLANKIGLTEKERNILWIKERYRKVQSQEELSKKPLKEGRDNKDVHVGSGGGGSGKVRYPSKKRSRAVWKKFYALFPYYAKLDGWDGKTSKRMK